MKKMYLLIITGLFLSILYSSAAAQNEFSSKTIHIGVVVSNLEESMEFYTEVVGMKQTGSFDVGKDFADKSGLSNGVPFHVKVLKLAEGKQSTQFKLMSFGDKPKKQHNEFIQDHTGMQYITINVKDLSPFIKRVRQHDIETRGDTPVKLDERNHFLLLRDPDGTIIELIGPWKDK
jgi:catechol 2,3-dioxygenase-like lactoylglutathione lyase family enzyme